MNRGFLGIGRFVVLATILTAPVVGQTISDDPREPLRGMPSIAIASRQSGCAGVIDESLLKQDVEVKLRVAGIRVNPVPLAETLNVVFNCVPVENNGKRLMTGIHLSLFVSQIVWLPPEPVRVFSATTWEQEELLVCGSGRRCDDEARADLRNYLDKFINDYLAMNPK